MVAAAQERPVGASDTARVRMTARRVPPVPGMPPSALGSPAAPRGTHRHTAHGKSCYHKIPNRLPGTTCTDGVPQGKDAPH